MSQHTTNADSIVNHWQEQQALGWETFLAQQENRLKDCVTIKPLSGSESHIDKILPLTFGRKTGRLQKTEGTEVELVKRIMYAQEYAEAKLFDEFDHTKLGAQSLPIIPTQKLLFEAAQRGQELQILEAALGDAHESKTGGALGVNTVVFDPTQVIDLDYHFDGTTSDVGLTYDKIARVRRLAMENEAYGDGVARGSDELVMALSAGQIEDLYHDVKVNNRDYVTAVGELRDGSVEKFLGIRIVRTEQVAIRDIGGGDFVRDVPVWVKSRMCFGLRNDYSSRMTVRDDLDEAIQIRAKFASGATRLEEAGVWKMPCLITA
jgi:hypothetical protein